MKYTRQGCGSKKCLKAESCISERIAASVISYRKFCGHADDK